MRVFFVGGASQARICHNILRRNGHVVPFIYDHTKGMAPPWDCKIFDDEAAIPEHALQCDGFVVCIGDAHGQARVRYSLQLRDLGLAPVPVVHPLAYFSEECTIGAGVQAMPRSYVGDYAVVGDYCILNNNCTVGHETRLANGVHVMASAVLTGVVTVGEFSSIGTSATVLPRLTIGSNCIIGAGAVVTTDVPDNAIVIGVPGRVVRYRTPEE
jgi:sugar O-acyltransferase (sialic acid O-acetyltransferase NeuD family)